MPKKSVGLTAPHPDYEPASFGTKCQGHCRILSAEVAFTFRHATGKSSQKRKGRDLQTLPTLLDIGYLPLFYIAAYLYCRIPIFPYCHIGAFLYSCIYIYMAIRTYIYADCLADLIVVHPFSVSYHGTACSLLQPLSLRLPLFLPDGGAKWRDCIMVSLTVHGRSLTACPLYLSLPFFGSGSFAGTTSFSHASGPGSGTVIFFSMHSVCFSWYRQQ